MSKMSEVPAMPIAIDPADSQIQSSLLELAGKLHEAFSQFAVHAFSSPAHGLAGEEFRPAPCNAPRLEENSTVRPSPSTSD
jgi:hypothetical protein